MNIPAIEKMLEEIKSGRIEELTEFKKKMLSEDLYVHQYILKLHYGNPTICDVCKEENSFVPLLKEKEIATGIMFRCKGESCHYRVFSAISDTVITRTKIRASKFSRAIDEGHKSVKALMDDESIDASQNTAENILHKLAMQGVTPQTNSKIGESEKELEEVVKTWLELGDLIHQYASLKMFEVKCEQFFRKIEK